MALSAKRREKLPPGAVIVAAMKFVCGTAQELINWQKADGYGFREQVEKVLADILRVKVFEASGSLAVKENQDGDDLGIGKPPRLIAMLLVITVLMHS